MRLLIAEDETDLAEALTEILTRNQYSVDTVYDGAAAYDYAVSSEYDAIILDIMMPKMDGIEVLKKIREKGVTAPVMMLTAKAEKDDRIIGFDSGADDYIPKPFSVDELLSRLRAILRRRSDYKPTVLTFGDLNFDCSSGIISCGKNEERLSGKEFQVMELFMRTPKTIFSTEKIMERVWGWDSDAELSVVWVHISNLRKKIKNTGSSATIRASRGLGYILEETDDR